MALLMGALGVLGAGHEPVEAVPVSLPRPVSGIVRAYAVSASSSRTPRTATAECPPGKQVMGGGGRIFRSSGENTRVALTQLEPYTAGTNPQGYRVSAAEIAGGTTDSWGVEAYAVCADPVPGHHIVGHNSNWSSRPSLGTQAACPDGERALGTGARITPFNVGDTYRQGIGLTTALANEAGTATLALAHEQPGGYSYDWRLRAFAVCANPPRYHSVRNAETPVASGPFEAEHVDCPTTVDPQTLKTVRSRLVASGAATLPNNGSVSLGAAFPDPFVHDFGPNTIAQARETTPTSATWKLRAQAICVL